jgi:hypothetical protein
VGKNVGAISKGRRANGHLNCMPVNGDLDDENIYKAWMVV